MKISVRDENQSALGATAVRIKDLSSGLQKITVRAIKRTRIPVKLASEEKPKPQPPESQPSPPLEKPVEKEETLTPPPTINQPAINRTSAPAKKALPSRLRKAFTKIATKVRLPVAIGSLVLFVAVASIYVATAPNTPDTEEVRGTTTTSTSSTTSPVYETPSFATILPEGKTIEQLGGWVRISPPEQDPVYAFADTIGSTTIRVSQQPLPQEFRDNPSENLKQLASNFGANEKVTANDTPVYIGTSAEGPQSVLFVKNDLLVLIKSSDTIATHHWTDYINTLQ